MSPVLSAVLVSGAVAALVAFVTMKANNRKAYAEAYRAEAKGDHIIISNLREEVTRLTEGQNTLRNDVDVLVTKLEECETERDKFKQRLNILEISINGKTTGGSNG